jgi:hypothetical protein
MAATRYDRETLRRILDDPAFTRGEVAYDVVDESFVAGGTVYRLRRRPNRPTAAPSAALPAPEPLPPRLRWTATRLDHPEP